MYIYVSVYVYKNELLLLESVDFYRYFFRFFYLKYKFRLIILMLNMWDSVFNMIVLYNWHYAFLFNHLDWTLLAGL